MGPRELGYGRVVLELHGTYQFINQAIADHSAGSPIIGCRVGPVRLSD
jgi:hypothetical protein